MKKPFIILLALLLTFCSMSEKAVNIVTDRYEIRSELAQSGKQKPVIHSIYPPARNYPDHWLTYIDDIDSFQVAYPADYPSGHPDSMKGMSIERPLPSRPCSTSLTGASALTLLSLSKGRAEWGRVDHFENEKMGEFETEEQKPICRPPTNEGAAGYALCSEHNGKTVVICINQMKDDPAMAKQIFETFRWTQ